MWHMVAMIALLLDTVGHEGDGSKVLLEVWL